MSETGYSKRLTAEDLIVLHESNRRWMMQRAWLYFSLGAGFGAVVTLLAVSLWGHL